MQVLALILPKLRLFKKAEELSQSLKTTEDVITDVSMAGITDGFAKESFVCSLFRMHQNNCG